MDVFLDDSQEAFRVGESDLGMFLNRPFRLRWELVFLCLGGRAMVSVGVMSYEVKLHTKVTLLPGMIFTLQEASDDFRGIFVAFSHQLTDEIHFGLEPSFSRFLRDNPTFDMPDDKVKILSGTFMLLNAMYQDRENCFRYETARNLLQCIFWNTYNKTHRHFEHMNSHATQHYVEMFRRFLSLVHIHSREQREVAFYADKLCISPRYLSFITKQITQTKSAKDMINEHIILDIKVLLQSTRLSIQEIAHLLNFPDQSYLGRYFKRYTGKSPSGYRGRM